MDSDDSYETSSEAFGDGEFDMSTSSDRVSAGRNSEEIPDLYASAFTGHESNPSTEYTQLSDLWAKLKEQNTEIEKLRTERIGFLEQITQLCTSLEKKEVELVEFMQSYEQKVNDVAYYMQEFQGLLLQLTSLFSQQLETSVGCDTKVCLPVGKLNKEDCPLSPADAHITGGSLGNSSGTNTRLSSDWDQRGQALLLALSASVATASARNKQDTLTRSNNATNGPNGMLKKMITSESSGITGDVSNKLVTPCSFYSMAAEKDPTHPELTVCRLPPFCWSPEHVIYWLSEYACLPGGCIQMAKQARLDGEQLTTLPANKLGKLLCLSDVGLRRKLTLALEDLRVHGPPGLSRIPGPSHLHPQWICTVWLKQFVGLAHLSSVFAVRRIDGRLLASLAIYKSSTRPSGRQFIRHFSKVDISAPSKQDDYDGNSTRVPGTPHSLNEMDIVEPTRMSVSELYGFRGASRKELCRILLGIGRDAATSSVSTKGSSGAELQPNSKFLLGRREARSLRAGIELLRRFHFNIEALVKAQKECELTDSNLVVWTNERISKWLCNLGLRAFTQGIEGSGLHGAYMVLDPTFDVNRLMKLLHMPLRVATAHKLEERLQLILHPARFREGITPKLNRFFRRRSISRPMSIGLLQRSVTSTETLNLSPPTMSTSVDSGPHFQHSNPVSNAQSALNGVALIQSPIVSTRLNCIPPGNAVATSPDHTHNPSEACSNGTSKFSGITTASEIRLPHPTSQLVHDRPNSHDSDNAYTRDVCATPKSSPSKNTSVELEERSETLVRKHWRNRFDVHRGTPVVAHRSSNQNQTVLSHLNRSGVQPSEVPLVDPFTHGTKGSHTRIVLGQSARLNSSNVPSPVHTLLTVCIDPNSIMSPTSHMSNTSISNTDRLQSLNQSHNDLSPPYPHSQLLMVSTGFSSQSSLTTSSVSLLHNKEASSRANRCD